MHRAKALAWILVVSKPGQELIAKANLERQFFPVYLPMKLYENRKRELRATPFFPRYLFVQIDARTEDWRKIWSTTGVAGVLGASMHRPPPGVRDWVVERIQAQEDGGYIRMMGEGGALAQEFGAGEVVRMAGSPLEAVFLEYVDAKRCVILVSLVGRDSHVTVDIAKLRATTTD